MKTIQREAIMSKLTEAALAIDDVRRAIVDVNDKLLKDSLLSTYCTCRVSLDNARALVRLSANDSWNRPL